MYTSVATLKVCYRFSVFWLRSKCSILEVTLTDQGHNTEQPSRTDLTISNNGTEAQALINDEPQPQSYQQTTTTSVAALQVVINPTTPAYAEQTEVTPINPGNTNQHPNTTTHEHNDGGIAAPLPTGK